MVPKILSGEDRDIILPVGIQTEADSYPKDLAM